jgi:hypothetical protein
MFETEIEIICAVKMALEWGLLVIVGREDLIRLNASLPVKTDSKTVLGVRIPQIR